MKLEGTLKLPVRFRMRQIVKSYFAFGSAILPPLEVETLVWHQVFERISIMLSKCSCLYTFNIRVARYCQHFCRVNAYPFHGKALFFQKEHCLKRCCSIFTVIPDPVQKNRPHIEGFHFERQLYSHYTIVKKHFIYTHL